MAKKKRIHKAILKQQNMEFIKEINGAARENKQAQATRQKKNLNKEPRGAGMGQRA